MLIVSPNLLGGGRNSSGKQTFRMIYAALIVVVATVVGFVASGFNPAGALAGFKLGMMAAGIYTTASSLIWNRPDLGNKKLIHLKIPTVLMGPKLLQKKVFLLLCVMANIELRAIAYNSEQKTLVIHKIFIFYRL